LRNREAGIRNHISTITGPWKAAAFFLIVVMILMLLNGAAILAGWHGASSRLMAYIALAAVGFFVSLALHAYLFIRRLRMQRSEEREQRRGMTE